MSQPAPEPVVVYVARRSATVLASLGTGTIEAVQRQGFQVVCCSQRDEGLQELRPLGLDHIGVPWGEDLDPLRDGAAWLLMTSAFIQRRPLLVHCLDDRLHALTLLAAQAAQVPLRLLTLLDPDALQTQGGLARRLSNPALALALALKPTAHATLSLEAPLPGRSSPLSGRLHHQEGALGVDLELFCPSTLPETDTDEARRRLRLSPQVRRWVGYTGSLEACQSPSLETTVQGLLKADPALGVLVAPQGPVDPLTLSSLRSLAPEGDRLVVLLSRTPQELPLVYRALDLCIAPQPRPEPLPGIMQAAAMRLPQVAFDLPWHRDLIDHERTGLLVKPQDQRAFVDATLSLLRSAPRRRHMGTVSRVRAERRFDHERLRLRLFTIYEALIEQTLGDPTEPRA